MAMIGRVESRRFSTVLACLLGAMLLSSTPARAQSVPPATAPPFAAAYLLTQIDGNEAEEEFVSSLMQPLRAADRDGNGLDEADIALVLQRSRAQARAQLLGQVLGYDLNGDTFVERAEIETVVRQDGGAVGPQVEQIIDRYDLNRDDRVSVAEILGAPEASPSDYSAAQLRVLLALDPNRDGRLLAAELRALASRAFARVDRDGDGRISHAEFQRVEAERTEAGQTLGRAMAEMTAPRCPMPVVPAGARVILFGGYTGESLSTVAVAGQNVATEHVSVVIEPGSQPLYLVLTSYHSMLWQLSGDTGRVAHVVVDSYTSARGGFAAAGVAGIRRDRVTILRGHCLAFFSDASSSDAARDSGTIRASTGRRPDAIFASHYIRELALPSGEITYVRPDTHPPERPALPGFDPYMWGEMLTYWRGGVVAVDPGDVVGPAEAEAYVVMPAQAGLAQLIDSGAIERDAESDTLRILRPIPRLPSDLTGSYSHFVLVPGVPVPPGDLGRACILVRETGEMLGDPGNCQR
jgi:Ca2+-binding EF-hand superfamily protein